MKKTDKVLIGIVGGIVLLVVVAFAVALTQPKPEYRTEDTPEGAAFNYLFALQQGDLARAYGYLSPAIKGYPRDLDEFNEDVRDYSWTFKGNDENATLEVESVEVNGERAEVEMRETRFYEGDLFSSSQYSNVFTFSLRRDENGDWKLVDGENYWLYCWNDYGGCR